LVGNSRAPIAGHVDLDFRAIPARRVRPLDCAAGVHLHSGHVHVEVNRHVPDIDKLPVGVAKLDQDSVVAFLKADLLESSALP
jgi:hypothetical protein